MFRRTKLLLIIIFLVQVNLFCDFEPLMSVFGMVYDKTSGVPLSNFKVALLKIDEIESANINISQIKESLFKAHYEKSYTNKDGFYQINNLLEGKYCYFVKAIDRDIVLPFSFTSNLFIIDIKRERNINLNFIIDKDEKQFIKRQEVDEGCTINVVFNEYLIFPESDQSSQAESRAFSRTNRTSVEEDCIPYNITGPDRIMVDDQTEIVNPENLFNPSKSRIIPRLTLKSDFSCENCQCVFENMKLEVEVVIYYHSPAWYQKDYDKEGTCVQACLLSHEDSHFNNLEGAVKNALCELKKEMDSLKSMKCNEQIDCSEWIDRMRLFVAAAIGRDEKYSYPDTPEGEQPALDCIKGCKDIVKKDL